MGQGEGADDPQDVEAGRSGADLADPLPVLAHQHRGQQQRNQEEQVVKAGPDMEDARSDEIAHFAKASHARHRDALAGSGAAQHQGVVASIGGQAHKPTVLGVEVGEQAVGDAEPLRLGRASAAQHEHRIGAVAVLIDQQIGGVQPAWLFIAVDGQARQGIGLDLGPPRLDLAPADRSVAVGVQAQGEVEIAQGDVPAPGDPLILEVQRQIAVARLVSLGGGRQNKNEDRQKGGG